jgi:hypothetical protein
MCRRLFLLLVVSLGVLVGCTHVMPMPQTTRTLTVSLAPDAAYTQAVHVANRIGASITHQDAQRRVLQAFMHGKYELTVQVEPGQGGSVLTAQDRMVSTMGLLAQRHPADEFLTAYRQMIP